MKLLVATENKLKWSSKLSVSYPDSIFQIIKRSIQWLIDIYSEEMQEIKVCDMRFGSHGNLSSKNTHNWVLLYHIVGFIVLVASCLFVILVCKLRVILISVDNHTNGVGYGKIFNGFLRAGVVLKTPQGTLVVRQI